MANPFQVNVPNALQALLAGEGGYEAGRGFVRDRVRDEVARDVMGGGDTQSAIARLMSIGDTQGAGTLAQIAQSKENAAFRREEAARSQGNADRSFALQERQFGASQASQAESRRIAQEQLNLQRQAAGIRVIKDANGNEQLVRIGPDNTAVPVTGVTPPAPGNPYATGKFNEVQGKAATFADRMAASDKIISGLEDVNQGAGGIMGAVGNARLPFMTGTIQETSAFNALSSTDRQKALQSQRDFVNAILRRESGAAISQSEFDNARRQYFPQPGDSQEVIAQKRQNRRLAIEGNMREAGPSYRPPEGWGGPSKQPQTTAQISDGMTATNPKTGQKIVFQNGQWVPVQ